MIFLLSILWNAMWLLAACALVHAYGWSAWFVIFFVFFMAVPGIEKRWRK